jgi:predicted SnoaL-like aldol condensation-catalyzing enzyme
MMQTRQFKMFLLALLLGMIPAHGRAGGATASLEANKDLVRSAIEQMFERRDVSLAVRFVAEDYIEHNPRLKSGRPAVVRFLGILKAAFPDDYHAEIQQILAEDDRVAVFIRWHGIQSGPFLGVTATGRELTFVTADIWRVAGGKLVEHWDVVDRSDRDLALGLTVKSN